MTKQGKGTTTFYAVFSGNYSQCNPKFNDDGDGDVDDDDDNNHDFDLHYILLMLLLLYIARFVGKLY